MIAAHGIYGYADIIGHGTALTTPVPAFRLEGFLSRRRP
jgi:hypothetical protein